ncbi:uncharacterized protein LOC105701690 isoform X2 [Orussus abietinus]|uniref:uncharacterized protein LOC105701690 isoform X2 n=1 Tax=Orussus abietinus TaxID=222816 RepID=UPI0006257FAF|nr:uncharacterized protein LOC105701690 isoform X2 [Orussus abietinus]
MSTTDVARIATPQLTATDLEPGRLKSDPTWSRRRGTAKPEDPSLARTGRCSRCGQTTAYLAGRQRTSCPRCRSKVCRQCQSCRPPDEGEGVGPEGLCTVCRKLAELRAVTGDEWTFEGSNLGRASGRRSSPLDVFRRSIRRSWTINGPPTRWSSKRRSPELRAYRSLPTRHRDYRRLFDVLSFPRISSTLSDEEKDETAVDSLNVDAGVPLVAEKTKSRKENGKPSVPKKNEKIVVKEQKEPLETGKIKRSDAASTSTGKKEKESPENQTEATPPRVSLIKPPRVLPKFTSPEPKPTLKHGERKSSIPIFRRSSREFEDIRSPQESPKRSLIPQRYRGSTDDLRRSREDISVPSLIPKLFSPRSKEDRLKRQDSKDEIPRGKDERLKRQDSKDDIRYPRSGRAAAKDSKESKESKESKDTRDEAKIATGPPGRDDGKSGIRISRRDSREDVGRESTNASVSACCTGRAKHPAREERQEWTDGCVGEGSRSRPGTAEQGKTGSKASRRESREDVEARPAEGKSAKNEERASREEAAGRTEERKPTQPLAMVNDHAKVRGEVPGNEGTQRVLTEVDREDDVRPIGAHTGNKIRHKDEEERDQKSKENVQDVLADYQYEVDNTYSSVKERRATLDANHRRAEDLQVVRRKFSKEELSNPDDTDDTPNRRCSSHLSPEASPLSTRSSRYSPRESESEPTPALPRKTGGGESCGASQRIRDAITRTRRESNSSARYESSGSESVRLSEPGLHGYAADLTRRVKFLGGGGSGSPGGCGIGPSMGCDEVVQRDSATSAGEDDHHEDGHGRDPGRGGPGSSQSRTMLRRRRQFDAQGSRRRGRSHARTCCGDDLQSLQALHVLGRGGGRQESPPGVQIQGQERSIVDYRRLVFISSDSSSGREEDDADSSCSGSSYLNGIPRGGHAQGLEDCDWDYFESGTTSSVPLPSLPVSVNTSNVGTDTDVGQDWSCCPGRGASSCQACGGSRGANVLPVPVPIPVPVPYPVPVPAALWTGDLAAAAAAATNSSSSSMISCSAAPDGTLRLRGDPATSWFAWHPRFHQSLHGSRIDPRLTTAGFDPTAFTFRPETTPRLYGAVGIPQEAPTSTESTRTSASILHFENAPKLDQTSTEGDPSTVSGDQRSSLTSKEAEEPGEDEAEGGARTSVDQEAETAEEDLGREPLSSFRREVRGSKMYRPSRGDSGSSSGRSSADSSDLEDSASHRFSRVFVVNDDSLTSDNDVEDNEDSDSAREGGITLKRVSALPEDEPVILRHVRLLDEDDNVEKPEVPSDSGESEPEEPKKRARTSSGDSAAAIDRGDPFEVAQGGRCRGRAEDSERSRKILAKMEKSEIYLADSKDCSDSHIELMSVKSLDPDDLESSSVSAGSPVAAKLPSLRNEGETDSRRYPKSDLSESSADSVFSEHETKDSGVPLSSSSDLDTTVTPDSLEAASMRSILPIPCDPDEDGTSLDPRFRRQEIEFDLPPVSDKTVTREDNAGTISTPVPGELPDADVTGCNDRQHKLTEYSSHVNPGEVSNASLTTDSTTSETNTGSEVSSDELHEYEVVTPVGRFHQGAEEEPLCEVDKDHLHPSPENTKTVEYDLETISKPLSTHLLKPEDPDQILPLTDINPSTLKTSTPVKNSTLALDTSLQDPQESKSPSSISGSDDDHSEEGNDSPGEVASTPGSASINTQSIRESSQSEALEKANHLEARQLSDPEEEETPPETAHSVGEIISGKIQEMFKRREEKEGESVRGERPPSRQVGGGRVEGGSATRLRSVERRPPARKENGVVPGRGAPPRDSSREPGFPSNKYRSLVMITEGAYQPVSVVTSDTTTLLQPDEAQPPQGLAGYFQLALEAASNSPRNGQGPRRPLMVKRLLAAGQAQAQAHALAELEPDSGLSVGSASESDDVQSVKGAAVGTQVGASNGANNAVIKEQQGPEARNEAQAIRDERREDAPPAVVILEEGLADDDSWVEEVSHDEDEQAGTTATEESSEDESNHPGDREEELRGYHRQAIDFTLHTIVEESCEESEAEPSLAAGGVRKQQRPPSASELEKYFFFGLGGENNAGIGAREVDSLSETSSIYSEGLESLGQEESPSTGEKTQGEFANSSRLEKYFLSEFLGFDQDRRDSDGSVGSDSEGRPSPEAQRRKRLVRARGTGRSHSSSLDNLLALTQSSQNLSSQNSLQDLSLNQDSQETQSEGSSTETDGAEEQTPAFGTDGQFDTVKRKKKKPRNLGTQSPRVPEDRNKTPEPREIVDATEMEGEPGNSDDERAETPQPEGVLFSPAGSSSQVDPNRSTQGNGTENGSSRGKQQSRDSGFVGSCDDLLLQHQKAPGEAQASEASQNPPKETGNRKEKATGLESHRNNPRVDLLQTPAPPPNTSLSRKDSFNNWSSDEETNLMMTKMRQFFKTMVANSNGQGQSPAANSTGPSPAPSPRLSSGSKAGRLCSQNRTKPPQLVYFENELTRLMKTVPGIRDDQVREIVEYLSSEDTWSDSYDSSDYTSSDLEGAGGRRSALQEQISQSCQQIISKFDATAADEVYDKAREDRVDDVVPAQPYLGRDTAFVYQKLVQSFTKMAGDGVSSDASSTPRSSPPLIAKVMHHIGSRLVALMHEVSESGTTAQPHSWRRYPQHHRTPSSASTTEDDDSTSDSTNAPAHLHLPRSKSHDPLLLINGHPQTSAGQEGEEREASDYERFSWRGSFESALMAADSRTKLSLLACSGDVSASASASALAMAAKRRSAGDLLFNPRSFSREQLDRVRSCGSIGGGGTGVGVSGSIEEKIWSNRRRSSVPDANTRPESGASAGDDDTEDELEYTGDSRATTLPRGMQAAVGSSASAATNSLPRLPASGTTAVSGGTSTTMHKAHSVYHFLPQHAGVKSARYRPPGFARNSLGNAANTGGPKRAVSAPGLQVSGSQTSAGKRDPSRSRRQQTISLTPEDGSSLSEACSTPIIGAGTRAGSSHTVMDMDDMDRGLHSGHLATRASLSSLGARSDSMASVYSGAGEGRWCGSVAVRGEVEFALQYDYKQQTFQVHVTQCRDLAPVDIKRNRSDPYVKVYLLPDKSKSGKRKTKVKKHTLNPVFDETLKFHMSLNGLESRTLWLTVWHSDMFGRNDFLGEVRMPLENKIFDDPTPRWYPLQERTEPFDDPIASKGEVIVGLKFVPPDPAQQQEREKEMGIDQRGSSKTRKNWSRGALHVLVKEARNLQTRAKHSGTCDPFCKSYLLPDKGRSGKQKTGIVRRCSGGSPIWGHTFVYKDVSLQELAERGLELTVWDHDRIASNEFLGGVRFNLGTGKHYGKPVDWMDATGRELSLWQSMIERPNFWVEGAVTLRPNLHNHGKGNPS